MLNNQRILTSALLALLVSASCAAAGDDGLYDAPPPPDSAYLRILNGTDSTPSLDVKIAGKGLSVRQHEASPYMLVKSGDVDVAGPKPLGKFNLAAGGFYTVATTPQGESKLFTDKPLGNPAKARVFFYNMTDKPDVDLYVPSASKNAVEDVAPSGSQSVELKAPLQLDFVARTEDAELARFDAVSLKRRSSVTFAVFGSNGKYEGYVSDSPAGSVSSN